MSDVHLRILRAAARKRARQLQDDHAAPHEAATTADARKGDLQRLASRARKQLARASARRRLHGDS
ncbi:MAG TPA: hypothetical protein VNT03_01015 [Baekduia sp.]|nr:hypothetical protein [Baekduia sp.]